MTLDEFLKQRGLSEESFGELIGVSQQSVNRYRRDLRKPSPEMARAIEGATEGMVRKESLRPDLWSASEAA